MILIGQYDSPFVRRVAIAMKLYGMDFEHRPWSSFSDAEKLAEYSPLMRVPVLVMEDGESLVDSMTILDHLDELAGPDRALLPSTGPKRRRQLRIAALAAGLADKSVALLYERVLHKQVSQIYLRRCKTQIIQALDFLEIERTAETAAFWFGETPGHADIMLACALRFLSEAHAGDVSLDSHPALADHLERCDAMPVFQEISQTFDPPR